MKHNLLLAAMATVPLWAQAQQTPTTPQSFIEQQRQQERERALREQNERTVDQRLQAAPPAPVARIPVTEAPCFRIDRVLLVGEQAEAFQWAVSDLSGPEGNDSPREMLPPPAAVLRKRRVPKAMEQIGRALKCLGLDGLARRNDLAGAYVVEATAAQIRGLAATAGVQAIRLNRRHRNIRKSDTLGLEGLERKKA